MDICESELNSFNIIRRQIYPEDKEINVYYFQN